MKVLDFRVRPRVPFYYQGLVPTPSKEIGRYIKVYHAEPRMSFTSMEESITEMREKGVEKGVSKATRKGVGKGVRKGVRKVVPRRGGR